MRVAQQLAGYSLEEADNLRKATGKKIRELIAKERSKFVDGCVAQGHPREFGEQMFDIIEPFADYSFNKSHTVGYGLVAYQTAYLKANHPREYLAALLTSVKGDKDKSAVYLNECRQLEIAVLVPDVNESEMDFAVEGRRDPLRLSAVRNVGEGVVAKIVEARDEGGPFTDFYDFCERVDPIALNKRTIESLIKAGAFDSLGHPRQGLFLVFEEIVDVILARRRERDAGIMSLFGDSGRRAGRRRLRRPGRDPRPGVRQEAAARVREGDARALRVRPPADGRRAGAAPLHRQHAHRAEGDARGRAAHRRRRRDRARAEVHEARRPHGHVRARGSRRRGRGHGVPEDDGAVRRAARRGRDRLREGAARHARGRAEDHRDGDHPARARARRRPAGAAPGQARRARRRPKTARCREILEEHPGDSPVFVHLEAPEKTTVLRLGDEHLVYDRNGLFAELRVLLGPDCIA